jgi:hypothetical protein
MRLHASERKREKQMLDVRCPMPVNALTNIRHRASNIYFLTLQLRAEFLFQSAHDASVQFVDFFVA